MGKSKILLSFDIEEFDLPREKGKEISLKEGVKISSAGTEIILKILAHHQIKATFFITGNFTKTNSELVKKIKKAGHEIACHGMDHFCPSFTDPKESKRIVEKVAGVRVSGYRQPRMFKISYQELKRQGYLYDSSVNPAFIPGRYNNFKLPRHAFIESDMIEIPASAATSMRIPMFWLALHIFPKRLYYSLVKSVIKRQDYFTTYLHPWEFTDFGGFKAPWYIARNSGDKLAQRLDWLIQKLKTDGNEFMTYNDYVKEWQNENQKTIKKQIVKQDIKVLTSKFRDFARDNRYLLKPFATIFSIYLVAISAILLAGVHYADDIARTSYGYAGWSGFSRYLSTVLSHGLHADNYLSNIAPLPQIIAVGLLAIAGVIVICLISGKEIFKEKWTKWIWRVIAVTPLGLCPYFLECLSYQYDAPYMALSILFVVFPLIFRKKSRSFYIIMIVISLWGMCTTYQASAGIFLVLMLFLGIKDWNEGGKKSWQESLKFLAWSCAGFLLAMLFFSKLLMIPRETYVSNDIPELDVFLSEFVKHLDQYFNLVFTDFKLLWLILIGIIGFCFVLLFVIRSRQNKIIATIVAVTGLMLMLVATYTPYSVLAKPLYATRAMYAIGSLIAVTGVYIVSGRGWQKIATVPVLVLAWCFFVFAFTYGNALKEQNDYRNMQVNMVISDLNELLPKLSSDTKNLQIGGQIGYTPVITHMPNENYYIIHRLIKSTFGRNVPWMAYRLTEGPILPGTSYNQKLNLQNKNLPTLKDTVFYTIKGDDRNILVEFKGEQMEIGL